MIFAGTPATTVFGETSLVTTDPAPIRAFSPIVIPHKMVALDPIEAPFFTMVLITFQSASVCGLPSALVALGKQIVCKHYTVTDKNIVFNMHAFTNKTMAGNFTIFPYESAFLNFHKCADFGIVINAAAISIYKIENPRILTEFYIIQTLFIIIDSN